MSKSTCSLSFEDVCFNYSGAICGIIRRYNKDRSVEDDLHQEVLLKMWRNWPNFDRDRGGLYTWISIITTNVCIDHIRKIRRRRLLYQETPDLKQATDLSYEADHRLHRCELLRLARALSQGQRDVIVMVYIIGHTQSEVSRLLHVPIGTVKSRQQSALRILRKMYDRVF